MPRSAHYLRLEDKHRNVVEGESEGYDFVGMIDVTNWDWNVTDQAAAKPSTKGSSGKDAVAGGKASSKSAAGGETGKKNIQPSEFTFNKYTDKATPTLMGAIYSGKRFKEACFTLREEFAGDAARPEGTFEMTVTLTEVVVTGCSISLKASAHGVDLDETWTLHYDTIKFQLSRPETRDASFDFPPGSEAEPSKRPPPTTAEELEKLTRDPKWLAANGLVRKGS